MYLIWAGWTTSILETIVRFGPTNTDFAPAKDKKRAQTGVVPIWKSVKKVQVFRHYFTKEKRLWRHVEEDFQAFSFVVNCHIVEKGKLIVCQFSTAGLSWFFESDFRKISEIVFNTSILLLVSSQSLQYIPSYIFFVSSRFAFMHLNSNTFFLERIAFSGLFWWLLLSGLLFFFLVKTCDYAKI